MAKTKRGIFTGKIELEAEVELEAADKPFVIDAIKLEHDFFVDAASLPEKVDIVRRLTFESGDLVEDKTYWSYLKFTAKKGKGKTLKTIDAHTARDVWLTAVRVLKDRVPRITYFPTFLFTFPEKIYLETPSSWTDDSEAAVVNRYYMKVLEDVAESIKDPDDPAQKISITKQVVDRLKNVKEPTGNPLAFWSFFQSRSEYDKVRSVLNLIAQQMGQAIFPAWNKIFDKPTAGKRVEISFGTDSDHDNIPWIKIGIYDSATSASYDLSERSLGFRWFFSFLLFTQFRKHRHLRSIYLFDEPAANLHSLAQTRLMEGFQTIVEDGSFILYSTHSHYLINPLWLEKAYIVKNAAVEYDESDLDLVEIGEKRTDITGTPYRQFIHLNPSRVSYFQPALDALRFNLGPMIPRGRSLVVEGKFDFHPMKYFSRRLDSGKDFDIFPVNGASDATALVALFRGWGLPFLIFLDDDKGGREAKKRYIKDLGVPEGSIVTLEDVDFALSGAAFEAIYGPSVVDLVSQAFSTSAPSKKEFSNFFMERTATSNFRDDLGQTLQTAEEIFARITAQWSANEKSSKLQGLQ